MNHRPDHQEPPAGNQTGGEAPPVPAFSGSGLTDGHKWSIVGLLFIASLINYFDRAAISFALPLLSKDLGLDPSAKGVLLSAFFWSYALVQIPVGLCADRVSPRKLYAGAFILWSVAQGCMGLAGSFGTLIVLRILLGLGESIYLPGATKIISLLFPTNARGFPCGLVDLGTRTGLVIEAYLLPTMLEKLGWRVTFMIIGFTALLWLIPWWLTIPANLGEKERQKVVTNPLPMGEAIRQLVTNRNLLGICLGFFCFDYYWYLLLTWLPDYLVTVRKLTILKAGFYSALPFMVFGICQPLGGWIADQLIRRGHDELKTRRILITIAFSFGLLLAPATGAESPQRAVSFIIVGCLVGLSTSNMLVLLQRAAPQEKIGLWVGIYNFIGNIGGILAPLVTGYMIKSTGSYTPPFLLASSLLIAGILCFWFIVQEKRPVPAPVTDSAG